MSDIKTNNRLIRINDQILQETAMIIRAELKDPRVQTMTSVVKADITNDFKHCKIHVSILGDQKQKKEVMEGLKNAKGFIRKQLAERINLRYTPELTFVLDDTLEHAIRINKLIDEAVKGSGNVE